MLGIIGIFLPLLPTTPFLLLAAACYIRSSERFYHALMHNKYAGKFIRNYREKRGIPLRSKLIALLMLWTTISYSALFVIPLLLIKILLFGIAIGVTVHLVTLKTLNE